jgi:hypothetical protein
MFHGQFIILMASLMLQVRYLQTFSMISVLWNWVRSLDCVKCSTTASLCYSSSGIPDVHQMLLMTAPNDAVQTQTSILHIRLCSSRKFTDETPQFYVPLLRWKTKIQSRKRCYLTLLGFKILTVCTQFYFTLGLYQN